MFFREDIGIYSNEVIHNNSIASLLRLIQISYYLRPMPSFPEHMPPPTSSKESETKPKQKKNEKHENNALMYTLLNEPIFLQKT